MRAFDLTGKTAVVTGGNGGLGLAMARGLVEAGAQVAIWGRDAGKNASAQTTLKADTGASVHAVQVDVADPAQIDRAMEETVLLAGAPDILINNAGVSSRAKPEELAIAEYERVLNINLTGALRCSQAVYPFMAKRKAGKIVNISSMMSIFGSPAGIPYSVSKGGLLQMTRSLAIAWASDNINVNAIAPGWFETDLTLGPNKPKEQVESLRERIVARTPLKRWGNPRDLAGAAVFLCSPAADFVTGTQLIVDGGFSVNI